jgi:hypothetical protein
MTIDPLPLPEPEEVPQPLPAPSSWPFHRRLLLFGAFLFFVQVNWPFPFDVIPPLAQFVPLEKFWELVVPPVAKGLFHVAADVLPNGSGDTTFNYVQAFLWLSVALVLGGLWAALDRKPSRNERVLVFFRIYLRFALAATLLGYGLAKVMPLQFPSPSLDRLVQTYGSSSPMGVLWTFMGTSRAYNFISGAAEVLAAALLTTRRTTLAGAMLATGLMGNIMALNFCYDVPVKLYSTELFLMAVILILPDARRLLDLFLLRAQEPLYRRKWLETGSLVFRTLGVTAFFLYALNDANNNRKVYGDLSPKSPLRGIWNVDQLTDNGTSRPPLITDLARWRRVIFDRPQYASIHLMSDTRRRYNLVLDEKKRTADLTDRDEPKVKFTLTYARPEPNTLVLDGLVQGHTLHAVCHRTAGGSNLLLTRGYHWVNEVPFNR